MLQKTSAPERLYFRPRCPRQYHGTDRPSSGKIKIGRGFEPCASEGLVHSHRGRPGPVRYGGTEADAHQLAQAVLARTSDSETRSFAILCGRVASPFATPL